MKYQLVSDVHGRFKQVKWDEDADIVLAAGDISENIEEGHKFLRTSPVPVLFLPGNHEYYKGDYLERHERMRELCEESNGHITFMDKEVVHLDDTRIIASTLWTSFNNFDPLLIDCAYGVMNDYRHISIPSLNQEESWRSQVELLKDAYLEVRKKLYNEGGIERRLLEESFSSRQKGYVSNYNIDLNVLDNYNPESFSPFVAYLLNKASKHWLEKSLAEPFDGKTLIMTHHAPSRLALSLGNYKVNPREVDFGTYLKKKTANHKIGAYTNSLEGIAMRHKIDGWVHGHFHEYMNYRLGSANVICNPTGTKSSATSGFETYIFNLDDNEKRIGLKSLLKHAIYVLSQLNSWFDNENRNETTFDKLNFASVLNAVWEEVEILIISLKSLPAEEIPEFVHLNISNPLKTIDALKDYKRLLTYDDVRAGLKAIHHRIKDLQPQLQKWITNTL